MNFNWIFFFYQTAGGLTAGLTPLECAQKELEEEAGVSAEIARRIKMVDVITYAYYKEDSVSRECEFVFDIKLPVDFKPKNMDGEVGEFYLMNVDEVRSKFSKTFNSLNSRDSWYFLYLGQESFDIRWIQGQQCRCYA